MNKTNTIETQPELANTPQANDADDEQTLQNLLAEIDNNTDTQSVADDEPDSDVAQDVDTDTDSVPLEDEIDNTPNEDDADEEDLDDYDYVDDDVDDVEEEQPGSDVEAKQQLIDRFVDLNPNVANDDNVLYTEIAKYVKEADAELTRLRQNFSDLIDMLDSDPRAATILTSIKLGESPYITIIREYGDEIRDILDSPEAQEAFAQRETQRIQEIAESRQYKEEYLQNLDDSIDVAQKWQEEKGLSDEQMERIIAAISQFTHDSILGKFEPQTFDLFAKALNYENDLAVAAEKAEIKGRNTRIEEVMRRKSTESPTPDFAGSASTTAPQPSSSSLFELARQAR